MAKIKVLGKSLDAVAKQANEGRAFVEGKVTDELGKPIVRALIQIRGSDGNLERRSKPTDDGTFRFYLPDGEYELHLAADGFCEVRRGPFLIKSGTKAKFDFQLFVCSSDMRSPGEPEIEDIAAFGLPSLQSQIMFGFGIATRGIVRYTGITTSGKYFPVVFYHDLTTLKANAITYRADEGSIVGEGDIFWREGMETLSRTGFEEIKIYLKGDHPGAMLRKKGENRWLHLTSPKDTEIGR